MDETTTIDDTLPPPPAPRVFSAGELSAALTQAQALSAEELGSAHCLLCGTQGCAFWLPPDEVFHLRFYCEEHAPNEARQIRNYLLTLTMFHMLEQAKLFTEESLTVASLVLLMVGSVSDENLESLQEGLRASEKKLHELFPHLAERAQASCR